MGIYNFSQAFPEPAEWIIKFVHYALFQRNDSVVGDLNTFRANLRAALRNVAVTDALRIAQFLEPVLRIERMHLERGDVNEKTWADEFSVLVVIAQHVADILT